MPKSVRPFAFFTFLLLVSALQAACSFGDKPRPETGGVSARPLEVPPGLSLPRPSENLSVPRSAATVGQAGAGAGKVLPRWPQGRLVQECGIRYLELNDTPRRVWHQAMQFFRSQDFEIDYQDPKIGVFQTDWQEHSLKEPSNWFASLFSKLTSSGLMTRYRVRLERVEGAPQRTRVYITQQVIEKVDVNEDLQTEVMDIRWRPRPPDLEQETEMMLRFLAFLGVSEAEAQAPGAAPAARATIRQVDGVPVVQVPENFARTWRRVGLALDRLGLLVSDRDRSQGLYYIQLTEEFVEHRVKPSAEEQGFFSRLFGGGVPKGLAEKRFRIRVTGGESQSQVSVRDEAGNPESSAVGKLLIELLHEQLR